MLIFFKKNLELTYLTITLRNMCGNFYFEDLIGLYLIDVRVKFPMKGNSCQIQSKCSILHNRKS